MDSLLKHMVDMTGHRDHAMLDISVVAAVQELATAAQTRVLSISILNGQAYLRSRASVGADGRARIDENHDSATPGEPLAGYPELVNCLENRAASAEACGPDGGRTLWLPIWCGDKADTCFEIVRDAPFPAATIHMITGIVGVYRNFQNLLDYSERDSLTGLLNRKTFEDQLTRMLQSAHEQLPPQAGRPERRCNRGDEQQWLAVIDVDHFKMVNDTFGHLYGDEVLILIANQLQGSFRSQDRVFRFGGEEFVVLLRSTTLDNARRIIDRFRSNVEAYEFPQVGRVTVSVGFVSINPFDSPVVTLGHADQALYYAKTHGRNQACHYNELVELGLLRTVTSNDTAEFF
ncbi:GGDEF domain-containing protein [Massilia sp. Dwa41.01b]|uniref:GGDEF domain-containing protein n=1 Tax=unclassified Massilia TaxID=2609279 RepID=UPI0016046DAF|nr:MULTISPECIES: GGDEF domain-containing protein [unclassified Massilia]QNA90798.1 GGDEF domain-containing protein [Massilia sp. Dwa41.01b]QNA98036.1 GGDEF domain-containing protein [Massilia sp. Se16.2.3]